MIAPTAAAAHLTIADLVQLDRDSWIDSPTAKVWALHRVNSSDGAALMGRADRSDYSGIVFPTFWPNQDNPREYFLRRDHPDYEFRNGTEKPTQKYLAPPGRGNQLIVGPHESAEVLTNPALPVLLVEGLKKTVSAWRLARWNCASPRFFSCGVTGVFNFRGIIGKTTDANGARVNLKGPIPDLGRIMWLARTVFLIFDSDALTNPSVRTAREAFAEELRQRGAHVVVMFLPALDGLEKTGFDDLLARWGPQAVLDWLQHAEAGAAEVSEEEDSTTGDDDLGDFPERAWRGAFKIYREAMDGTSEAPDTAHFSALWAMAAACLRRRVSFYYAYPHYPNVYLVNYGNTGDSKTSAGRQGLRLLPEHGIKLLRGVGSAEALGDWMQQREEGPTISHLLFIEELATLLIRGGWEGSTLLSFLTETFDAPDKYEIPFRKNPVLVQEPTPTLLAGTTIEWLWKGLREIDVHGGFGNRIFYLSGTPKPPIPLPRKPNAEALGAVRRALERLTTYQPLELLFTPDAEALWQDFYVALKSTTWPELTAAAIKRVPTYIVKLSMVYACFEGTSLITADQLSAAIEVGNYGAKCAHRLMNRHRQHTVQGKCEGRVLAVLKEADLPAWKIHHGISGSFNAEELARSIRALETAGAIIKVRKTTRGEAVYGRRDRKREV
jgi:hypothetical protein